VIDGKAIVWEPLPGSQSLAMACPCNHILFHGARGPGKDLHVDTLVFTQRGRVRAGDVTYSDKLVAPDGTLTAILGIFPKSGRPMNRVVFEDGAEVVADDEHRWLVYNSKNGSKDGWRVKTTRFLRDSPSVWHIPYIDRGVPGRKWSGLDPYLIGMLIGDGTTLSAHVTFYNPDEQLLEDFARIGWMRYDYADNVPRMACPAKDNADWVAAVGRHKGDMKRVPVALMEADLEARLSVLQGLLDTDGHCDKEGRVEFKTVSERLAKDAVRLAFSLGGSATARLSKRQGGYGSRDWIYRVKIAHHNRFMPFRLRRKAERIRETRQHLKRRIVSIEPCGLADGVCFAVAHPSKCFVVENYIVTHNTDAQLMFFRRFVGAGYGAAWRGVIFDREYKNLDDLVVKARRWFPQFRDGARFLSAKADYKWTWPSGEELLFRQMKTEDDYWKFHGQEFSFVGWNELCKQPSALLFDLMMSCNRSGWRADLHSPDPANPLPPIPLVVFATANPYGPGHNWVKRRFIDAGAPGEVVERRFDVFDPQTGKRAEQVKTQAHIFGSYKENTFLSPEYIAELEAITDENRRKAWLHGDWDIVAGGAFDDLWRKDRHVLRRFRIPAEWYVDRSFDWGSSHPFSVGWWAEANGEEVATASGQVWCPPKGTLFRIAETYGTRELGTNEGLKMSAREIARGIVDVEAALVAGRWCARTPAPGPADNQIWNESRNDNGRMESIASKMSDNGIEWTRSNKGPGSRKNGFQLLRDRLQASLDGGGPGIYFFDNCKATLATLPVLPRDTKDPDDVDTTAEDHIFDETRYRCLAGQARMATRVRVTMPT